MPPRHGKTILAAQIFPAWFLGRNPDKYVIIAIYGQDLADDTGRMVRNFVTDPMHTAIFPACRVAQDSASMRRFNTSLGGAYFAVGRGAAITGRGAHLLLLDDLIKDAEEARSDTVRRGLHQWYSTVAYTRLQSGAAIIGIGTRWHEDDWFGHQLAEDLNGWEVVSFPAIAERNERFRKEGQALWPKQYSLRDLQEKRQTIGGAAFEALYQQRPSAIEGEIFRREWWQSYSTAPASGKVVQSWDTSFGKNTQGDYSVCTTWLADQTGYYLLNLWRDRVEFPALKAQLVSQAAAWHPNAIIVEDTASGQSLIQEIRTTALPILPIKADSDKISRASAVTPLIESGRVFLPQAAGWLQDFMDELAAFPNGAHDDQVDSLSMALNWFRTHGVSSCSPIAVRGSAQALIPGENTNRAPGPIAAGILTIAL